MKHVLLLTLLISCQPANQDEGGRPPTITRDAGTDTRQVPPPPPRPLPEPKPIPGPQPEPDPEVDVIEDEVKRVIIRKTTEYTIDKTLQWLTE
jgi:hypothetical protein